MFDLDACHPEPEGSCSLLCHLQQKFKDKLFQDKSKQNILVFLQHAFSYTFPTITLSLFQLHVIEASAKTRRLLRGNLEIGLRQILSQSRYHVIYSPGAI